MTDKLTRGVHHVGITVPDLEQAEAFFCDALGWDVVGRNPAYPAVFVSDGQDMVTVWRAADPSTATAFDRRGNIGLHHLAIAVADETALETVFDRVRAHPGVAIEFAPAPLREGSKTRHFMCAMPGGVRIEFATPSA